MTRRRVVVTGLGCVSPVGNTVAESWANALAGRSGITPLPTPEGLRLTCPRELKVAALAALAPLGTRLADVQIHEPSLEDVYFGLREL